MNCEIRKIGDKEEAKAFAPVIRAAYCTVAKEMGFTKETTPSNPAFIEADNIELLFERAACFGAYLGDKRIGFFLLKKTKKEIYTLEKMCVLPEYRQLSIGKALLDYAKEYVIAQNGHRINIAILDLDKKLKKWYFKNGYSEISKMKFPHLPYEVCLMRLDIQNM